MTTVAVILAGGRGRRIGGGKPLRLLAGRSLIERAMDFANTQSAIVAVSLRETEQAGAIRAQFLVDDPVLEGPLAGLAAALAFAELQRAESVLTIPCDGPFLPPDLLSRLEAALAPDAGVAVARSNGRLHPVCALWRTAVRSQVKAYAVAGASSLIGFARQVGHVAVEWPSLPIDPFFNINRDADLRHAEALLLA